MTANLLSDLRVFELSAFVAAPLGGMTLAQLGAEVIRIDPIGGGMDYQRWPVTPDNVSLFWCGLNKSKKSITIDLRSEQGKELAQALIVTQENNTLLTNFPPRGLLDYDTLSVASPSLIQLTVTGDRHGRSAVDYTVNPTLGLPMITGPENSTEMCNHVLPAWDLVTGHIAVIGILAAERQRQRTGKGQHIRLALEDAALAMMGHLGFIAEAQQGDIRERSGNYLYGAFGRDFTTADKNRIMIVGLTPRQWRGLCRATGLDEKMAVLGKSLNLDLDREGDRFKARQDIAALIEQWCLKHDLAHIKEQFDANGVCWSVYQTLNERLADTGSESLDKNPLFSTVTQPGVGPYLMPGLPLEFTASGRTTPTPAPLLGQHTEEVLADVLGLTTAQIGQLVDQKTIGTVSDR